MSSAELIKLLKKDGWALRGVKGSHHIYTHPVKAATYQRATSTQGFGQGFGA